MDKQPRETRMSSGTPFGRLIRQRRVALGLSPAGLADLVGRSASSVRSWERGSSTPTDENVLRSVAAVLGIEEGALRSAIGMPGEVPREELEEVGGERLAAFTGEVPEQDETPGQLGPVDDQDDADTPTPEGRSGEQMPAPRPVDTIDEVEGVYALNEAPEEPLAVATPVEDSTPPAGDLETQATVGEQPDTVAGDMQVGSRGDEIPAATATAAGMTSRTVAMPVSEPPAHGAAHSYLNDPDQMMTYWVRTVATVAFGVFLIVVLFWALARLGDSIGEVWDLFQAGT